MRGLRSQRRGETPAANEVPGLLSRLIDGTPMDRRSRAGVLSRLTVALGASARRAGAVALASGGWLTDVVADLAPHVPVRDYLTLRDHYGGLSGNELAQALIDNAARSSGAIGAAGGVLSAVEFTAPPMLLTTPVQVAAETVAVVSIELKLVAELHEVYRRPAVGTPAVRTAAYLGAWTRRRGLDPFNPGPGLAAASRRELRRRVIRRAGGNATTLMPLLAGAVAGASLNSRETRRLGQQIANDLAATP